MRLGFMLLVIAGALFTYKFIDNRAAASPQVTVERQALAMGIPFEKVQARTLLNDIRQAMGMLTLTHNEQLEEAAQAHADYLVLNHESSHDEIKGHLNYTGEKPKDRALAAGYNASYVSENLSSKNVSAQASVDGLFSAIYHRFGFLNPSIDAIGVGVAQDEKHTANSAFVYVMGNSELNALCTYKSFNGVGKYVYGVCRDPKHHIADKKFKEALALNKQNNPKIILYPYEGQREVPPAFYSEVPDPLPEHEVSGFPISVEFNDYYFKDVKVHSFELYKGDELVDDVLLMDKHNDPHMRFTDKQFALFPLKRLAYTTQYRAVLSYSVKSETFEISWSFKTQTPKEKLHIIRLKEEELTLKTGQSHIIYFKPLNAHDLVKNVRFPSTIDIEFLDNNAFKLTLNDKDIRSFDIVSDSRMLHVKIEKE